jgi:nickel-dependent lactate racemase
MRGECDAAGDLAGLNFKIDCLINRRGQVTDIYSGTFRATHAAGASEGKDHYGITCSTGYDIVVCNSYAKASESAIALLLALQTLKPGQGTAVLISVSPEGQVPHYVMRAWGIDYGGRHYNLRSPGYIRIFMKKLIVMNPYPDKTCLDLVCDPGDAVIVKTWDRVIEILKEEYPEKAKVAVIPDGTMQYIKIG